MILDGLLSTITVSSSRYIEGMVVSRMRDPEYFSCCDDRKVILHKMRLNGYPANMSLKGVLLNKIRLLKEETHGWVKTVPKSTQSINFPKEQRGYICRLSKSSPAG